MPRKKAKQVSIGIPPETSDHNSQETERIARLIAQECEHFLFIRVERHGNLKNFEFRSTLEAGESSIILSKLLMEITGMTEEEVRGG